MRVVDALFAWVIVIVPAVVIAAKNRPLGSTKALTIEVAQLRAAGVTVESVIYPGATHSFLEAVSMAAVSNRAFDDEAQWLRRIFGEAR